MLLVQVEEPSLLAVLTPFGRPIVAWVVILLVTIFRCVVANEKSYHWWVPVELPKVIRSRGSLST